MYHFCNAQVQKRIRGTDSQAGSEGLGSGLPFGVESNPQRETDHCVVARDAELDAIRFEVGVIDVARRPAHHWRRSQETRVDRDEILSRPRSEQIRQRAPLRARQRIASG